MKRMKKSVLWFLIGLLSISMLSLIITVSGCKEEAASAEEVAEVEEDVPSEEVVEEVPAEVPQELIVSLGQDMDNFDPHTSMLMYFAGAARLMIYDFLVGYDTDLNLVPGLAESWETDDYKTFIFHLREGVKFHNGKDFKAEDVKYTFDRIADPETGAYVSVEIVDVESFKIIDDYTIEIVLKDTNVSFIHNLTAVSIVPNDPGIDLRSDPIGTGPYKFVEYIPNDRTVFEKFEDYWDKSVVKNDKITFKIIPDDKIAVTNLETGVVDMVLIVSPAFIGTINDNPELKTQILEDTTTLLYFQINVSEEPLDNLKIRQAMAMCFDYDAFGELLYKGHGSKTNNCIIPMQYPYKDVGMYEYNPEKAKEILEEEGYAEGFDFTINVIAGYDRYEQMALLWKDGLDKAGINTSINKSEVQIWLDQYMSFDYLGSIDEYATKPDPFSFFNVVMIEHTTEVLPDKEEYKEMIREPLKIVDEEERIKKYQDLQDWMFNELPGIFVIYRVPIIMGMKENLQGVTVTPNARYNFTGAYFE